METYGFYKYYVHGRMILKRRLAYKIDTFLLLALQVMSPLVMLFVWAAVYFASNVGSINNFTFLQITSYFFVVAAINAMYPGMSWSISGDIKNGNIFTVLTRPISYVKAILTSAIANFCFDTIALALPIMVLLYIFSGAVINLATFLLFILSVLIMFVMAFMLEFFLGYLAFFIVEISGIVNLVYFVVEFAGGGFIPLNLLPSSISTVTALMPFQFMQYVPAAIFTHAITNAQTIALLPIAAFWMLVLLGIDAVIWYIARKHMDVVGV